MPNPRIAGKLGRLDAVHPVGLHWLVDLITNPLPPAPRALDHTKCVAGFGMYGNDQYGDCTVAGAVNLRAADAHVLAESETWPSAQQVIDAYLAYTHGADAGAIEADLLEYWRTNGILGSRIVGHAPLHVSLHAELKSAMALFGGVYTGIKVPDNAIAQFEAGETWHLTGAAADDEYVGGHCVPLLGYTSLGPLCVTWGAVQHMTWAWWDHVADEAHAVITHEFVAAKPGVVNLPLLEADLKKLAA